MAGADWRPKANPWVITVVVSLAAFMEVLDTSIANVALPHIAGGLAATDASREAISGVNPCSAGSQIRRIEA